MSIEDFTEKMKKIQSTLLEFLEDESNSENKYESFVKLVSDSKIINERHKFEALLKLINSIGNNHHRDHNFICKIERVLRHFKKDIQKYFTNSEIFEVFDGNKRIHLFLVEEKVITIDEHIFSIITNVTYSRMHYCEYFKPEIKPLLTEENIKKYGNDDNSLNDEKFVEELKKEVEEDFYKKRREGESDDFLCKLIRFNKIKEFITFAEQTNLSLDNEIKNSIYETNEFLSYVTSLIEYASFYGSNDIIKYMKMKGVKLRSDIWYYAIHSMNAELIQYLEDNHVSPPRNEPPSIFQKENNYELILEESIKCHHNEIASYIIDNLMKEEDLQYKIENKYRNLYQYAVEYHNYYFFPANMKYENMFFYFCEFNYYALVKLYLEEGNIDINAVI